MTTAVARQAQGAARPVGTCTGHGWDDRMADGRRVERMDSRTTAAGLVCSMVLVAACSADDGASPDPGPGSTGPTVARPAQDGTSGPQGARGVADIVQAVEPSVVTIFAGSGLGSGVVFREDGTIITNEHVVRGATQVQIAFADGQRGSGTVLATDVGTDLAVVRSERRDLPAATFETELPRVGSLAVALGSPLGFEGSATAGIISGLGREIPGSAAQGTALVDLIQTDAAISPGNSGGALVDGDGAVVGINDAYIPPAAGAVSLGFAIPSATVVDVVEQLLDSGEVQRTFVGIRPGRITAEVAQQLGLSRSEGVLVLDVVDGAPAAEAGLRPGDVVTSIGPEPVPSLEAFLGALRVLAPGQTVPFDVVRQGEEQTVQVTLGSTTG